MQLFLFLNLTWFQETALYWTWRYAKGSKAPNKAYKDKVEKIRDMGIPEACYSFFFQALHFQDEALTTLSNVDWDMTKAMENLFS